MEYTHVTVSADLYKGAKKCLPRQHFNDLFEFRGDTISGHFVFNIDKFDTLGYTTIANSIKLHNSKIKHRVPLFLTLIIMNLIYLISLVTTLNLFYPTFLFVVFATMCALIITINTHRMIRESNATTVLMDMVLMSGHRTDLQIYGLLIKSTTATEVYNGNRSQQTII